MDFRFDSEERAIIDSASESIKRFLPRERLRDESPTQSWQEVAAAGWLHAGLSEDHGGADLPLTLLAALGREAGSVLAGESYVNNAVVLPELLAAADSGADGLLEEHAATPGFLLADGRTSISSSDAHPASVWCFGVEPGFACYQVVAQDGGSRLRRYSPGSWTLARLGEVALGVGEVTIDGASPELDVALVSPDLDSIGRRAAIVHAASLVGLGEQALRETTAYALDRKQFAVPIGSFQAVKHELANIAIELEVAWNSVLYAALYPTEMATSIAKLHGSRSSLRAARGMVQIFGGVGVTMELDVHLFLKSALAGGQRFGDAGARAVAIGEALLRGEAE